VSECVHETTHDGSSVPHYAAQGGSLELVKWLINACGVDASRINKEDTPAVHWAAGTDHLEVVQFMHSANPRMVFYKNPFGSEAVHWAASGGAVSVLHWLAQTQSTCLTRTNHHGHDAMTKAVAFNRPRAVQFLFNTVLPVSLRLAYTRPWDETEQTIAQTARLVGAHEVVQLLDELHQSDFFLN